MAEKEMYDYLPTVTPDNDQTLDVKPHRVIVETASKNQVVHEGDDGSEERIDFGEDNISIFHVTLQWEKLREAVAGTLFEFYNAATHGNGITKTFKWINYGEPAASRHTYVIRFDCDVNRSILAGRRYGVTNVKIKAVGRILD